MYDDVLNVFYIWTYPDVKQTVSINDEIERAVSLGIGTVKPDNPVLGWYSNDYINIITGDAMIAGFTPVNYQGNKYCIELLQMLQKWQ